MNEDLTYGEKLLRYMNRWCCCFLFDKCTGADPDRNVRNKWKDDVDQWVWRALCCCGAVPRDGPAGLHTPQRPGTPPRPAAAPLLAVPTLLLQLPLTDTLRMPPTHTQRPDSSTGPLLPRKGALPAPRAGCFGGGRPARHGATPRRATHQCVLAAERDNVGSSHARAPYK